MTLYPWQNARWSELAMLTGRWPHALLIHGQPGIGKTDFAWHLAQALLCEARAPHAEVSVDDKRGVPVDWQRQPCGQCVACRWFERGNHPDFRAVCPESLAGAMALGDVDAENGKDSGKDSGKDGEKASDASDGKGASKSKVPSKEIKVEQIRSLIEFCGVGAHRGGRRIALVYPAETLNVAAANALLKTLEEPPESVAFLLVSSAMERLLPTIVSRCRQWPMPMPDAAQALVWLEQQARVQQPQAALAQAGGAPLAALAQVAEASTQAAHDTTLAQLESGAQCDVLACADLLNKLAPPLVYGWLQRWLYDLLSVRLSGVVRYYPQRVETLRRCAAHVDPVALAQMNQWLARERRSEQHPLNARLVFESLFHRYRSLFDHISTR